MRYLESRKELTQKIASFDGLVQKIDTDHLQVINARSQELRQYAEYLGELLGREKDFLKPPLPETIQNESGKAWNSARVLRFIEEMLRKKRAPAFKLLTEGDDNGYFKNWFAAITTAGQIPLYIPSLEELFDVLYQNSDSKRKLVQRRMEKGRPLVLRTRYSTSLLHVSDCDRFRPRPWDL